MGDASCGASPSVRAAPIATEHQEQCAVIQWWALASSTYKLPENLLFAIPNGGQRHVVVAAKLKAEGVRAGAPDLFLAVARGEAHGLFIELKRKKAKATPRQTQFLVMLFTQGYGFGVCQGADEAIETIKLYLDQG